MYKARLTNTTASDASLLLHTKTTAVQCSTVDRSPRLYALADQQFGVIVAIVAA